MHLSDNISEGGHPRTPEAWHSTLHSMHVNVPQSTRVDSDHFHPSKSHCIFMCVVGSEIMLLSSLILLIIILDQDWKDLARSFITLQDHLAFQKIWTKIVFLTDPRARLKLFEWIFAAEDTGCRWVICVGNRSKNFTTRVASVYCRIDYEPDLWWRVSVRGILRFTSYDGTHPTLKNLPLGNWFYRSRCSNFR